MKKVWWFIKGPEDCEDVSVIKKTPLINDCTASYCVGYFSQQKGKVVRGSWFEQIWLALPGNDSIPHKLQYSCPNIFAEIFVFSSSVEI